MPLKRNLITQSIFAFCVICFIFIFRQAGETTTHNTSDCVDCLADLPEALTTTSVIEPPLGELDDPLAPPPIPPQPTQSSQPSEPQEAIPPPINEMESQAETDIASELLPPSLEEQQQEEQQEDAVSEGRRYPFTIVTAASGNHFCALESMLYTLRETRQYVKEEEFPRIVVYDLGITPKHKAVLDNLYALQYFDELVQFEFDKYPTFWDITVERGQYAWKTGIVKEVQEKIGGIIVWLDTGDVPNPMFLKMIPNYIRQHGFWSPRSTGFIGSKFNHLGMFKYFHARRKDYAHFENCNGAALGFDADNKQIVDQLITPWYDCGMNKRCIAPKGSSRQNHRQDQSAITFLAIRAGFQCVEYPEFHGLTIHQDDYCHQRLQTLEAMGVLSHPSFIDM